MEKGNVLSYKEYYTRVVFDSEVGKLTGIIEGINDLVYFESDNTESIINEFHLAVDDYLDFCSRKNIQPDKVFKGTFNVRIDPELHKKLSQHAFTNGESLNSTVEESIRHFLYFKQDNIFQKLEESIASSISLATENVISRPQNWDISHISNKFTNSSSNCLENWERMIESTMRKFNEFFEKQGTIYLNDINYRLITLSVEPVKASLVLNDNFTTKLINDNKQLRVVFTRTVSYLPKSLFELTVSYGAIYNFKNEIFEHEDLSIIDFQEMLKENNNVLFLNIISRTSQLVSQITSSHGAPPVVTPPLYIVQY